VLVTTRLIHFSSSVLVVLHIACLPLSRLAFRVHAACRSLRTSTRKKTRTRQ
jgi:hypothetical protein